MADTDGFRERILESLETAVATDLTADAQIGVAAAQVLALVHLADVLEGRPTAGPDVDEDEVLDERPKRPIQAVIRGTHCTSKGRVKGWRSSGSGERETSFVVQCVLAEHAQGGPHVFHAEWGI